MQMSTTDPGITVEIGLSVRKGSFPLITVYAEKEFFSIAFIKSFERFQSATFAVRLSQNLAVFSLPIQPCQSFKFKCVELLVSSDFYSYFHPDFCKQVELQLNDLLLHPLILTCPTSFKHWIYGISSKIPNLCSTQSGESTCGILCGKRGSLCRRALQSRRCW